MNGESFLWKPLYNKRKNNVSYSPKDATHYLNRVYIMFILREKNNSVQEDFKYIL